MPIMRKYAGSNANQLTGLTLGTRFTVNAGWELTVTDLGSFIPALGLDPSTTITVKLEDMANPGVVLRSVVSDEVTPFTTSDIANRVAYSAITPIVLSAGTYVVYGQGYITAAFMAYNADLPGPGTLPTFDTMGGALTHVGDYYGGNPPATAATALGGGTLVATAAAASGTRRKKMPPLALSMQDLPKGVALDYKDAVSYWVTTAGTLIYRDGQAFQRTLTVSAGDFIPSAITYIDAASTAVVVKGVGPLTQR